VVPVFFGSDPSPGAGVHVGTIRGHGVVLTCLHAAKHGVRTVAGITPVDIYRDQYGYDMVAVIVPVLDAPAVTIGAASKLGDAVEIIGYPLGRFHRHRGRVVGYFRPEGKQPWGDLSIDTASQDGDSGGAVLASNGTLVGLLWGTRSDGGPGSIAISAPAIADFLRRLEITLRKRDEPAVPTKPPPAKTETPQDDVADSLRKPLDGIRDQQPSQIPSLTEHRLRQIEAALTADGLQEIIGEVAGTASPAPSLTAIAVPAIMAGLGWTGPPAIAAVVGLKVLSLLIRRRRKRRSEEAADSASEFPPAESVGSLPRDDTEAREFLQLSQLEGRSPLHDALVGRVAFDELDKAIDSKPDGPHADWARALKRTLEQRFNEMAPPAVFAAAGKTS
jgi:hypothetical protein